MANRIKGLTIEIGGNTTKLQRSLSGLDRSLNNTQNKLKDIDKLLKLDPRNTELLTQKQKALETSITGTKDRLKELKAAQAGVAKGTDEWDALQREIIATEQNLKGLKKEYLNFGSVAAQQISEVGKKMEKFGTKVSEVGSWLTTRVTLPIIGAGTAAVKASLDFDDALAKLSTIAETSGRNGLSMDTLRDQILDLSNQTGISAAEIANNVYDAISAGQSTADAVNFVAQSSKLAAAGFADSGAALDILTTIMNSYGMSADQVIHVSDVLINTQNKGKTTVAQLASSMGKVIPTANAAGVSLEQLAAGYSIMTANGIATAESTTYMNSLLNELSKTGTKSSDALKNATGQTFQELMASGSSLADVLDLLKANAEANGLSLSDMFGSAEAGKAALVLLGDGVADFNAALHSMEGIVNATDEAYQKLDTNTRKGRIALTQLTNTAVEFGKTILDMAQPAIDKASTLIGDLTTKIQNLDPKQKEMIVKIAGIVAAVGPALVVGGKLIGGIGKFLTLAPKVVSVVKLLTTTGLGPLGLALGALVAVGVTVYNHWDEITAWWSGTVVPKFEQAGAELRQDWEHIKATGAQVRDGVVNAWQTMKDRVAGIIDTVKGKIDGFRQKFADLRASVADAIDNIRSKFNFEWSLPHIKLPHFRVQGGQWPYGLGGEGYLPSIHVDWYKKAYRNPVLFNSPTVMATPNGYKGFGDGSGAEIVMGLDRLRELVGSQQGGSVTINVYPSAGMDEKTLAREIQQIYVNAARDRRLLNA